MAKRTIAEKIRQDEAKNVEAANLILDRETANGTKSADYKSLCVRWALAVLTRAEKSKGLTPSGGRSNS